MLLRIQPYQCTIEYKPGKDMVFADYLSRSEPSSGENIELDKTIHGITMSENRKIELQDETKKDKELKLLSEQILNGWPENPKDLLKAIRQYWSIRDNLSTEDGMILKGTAILIPRNMRKLILDKIHTGHQGQEKCQLVARDNVFWIGISKDIINLVQSCEVCNKYSNRQQRQPLLQPELPGRPFEKLAADIFQLDGQNFLLLADYFSKMPFVKSLKNMTSQEVINYMQSVFAIHGIPKTLITDNAMQFTSSEFQQFTKDWEFKHTTSSSYYPRSNGLIERTVQTVKSYLKKAKETKQNPQLALLCMRTTPIDHTLPSLAEILFNRQVQTIIPKAIKYDPKSQQIRQRLNERQAQQKKYYDRGTKDLPILANNQEVMHQDPIKNTWSPAVIVEPTQEPRSYLIKTPEGAMLRRNRIHLHQKPRTPSKPHHYSDIDDDVPADTEDKTLSPVKPQTAECHNKENDHDLYATDTTDRHSTPSVTSKMYSKGLSRNGRPIKPPRRFDD